MSAYAAPIEVCQAALHRCGEESIVDMDEASPASVVAQSNYEGIVRAQLDRHGWLFATETVNLIYLGPATAGNFVYAWLVPAEVINIRWVECNGRRLRANDYIIRGAQILTRLAFTDAGSVLQVVGTIRAQEGVWADDFAEAMVVRMQGLFLESLADKWQDGAVKMKQAELLFRQAIVRDKRQQPATSQEYNRLAEVYRNIGGRGRFSG